MYAGSRWRDSISSQRAPHWAERVAHRPESLAQLRQLISCTTHLKLRDAEEDSGAFQRLKSLGQQCRGDSRYPLADLVEGAPNVLRCGARAIEHTRDP